VVKERGADALAPDQFKWWSLKAVASIERGTQRHARPLQTDVPDVRPLPRCGLRAFKADAEPMLDSRLKLCLFER
jgi:hypothetical protein